MADLCSTETTVMTPLSDDKYMDEALAEARKALQKNEIPIGAVVVADGMVIGRGHNLTETLHDVTAHAEMLAITAATERLGGKYLDKCTLYVTVEPCAPDVKRGFQTFAPKALHPKCQCVGGVKEQECAQLMKDFFKQKR